MADSNELLPEEVDEQNQRLIHDLRRIYHIDGQKAEHLARIHQRLTNSDISAHGQPNQMTLITQQVGLSSRSAKRTRSTAQGGSWQRRLSMIAAVVFATLLVSSLLLC